MNDRILKAINTLNNEIKSLKDEIKNVKDEVERYKEESTPKKVAEIAREIDKYKIQDGKWFYGGEDTGNMAIGPQGDPFTFDDLTPDQIALITGADGEKGEPFTFDDLTPEQIALLTGADGMDGKDGKDGAPGKDGKDGAPGPAGKDGKDGITPKFVVGEINSVSTYDPAKIKLVKKE